MIGADGEIAEITVRPARQSDKDEILSFCTSTFSWGDYISEVWDTWLAEENSKFVVAHTGGTSVGIAHASLCPDRRSVWLEGIRIRRDLRRCGIASTLMHSVLEYGLNNGATEALAIVSVANSPSRRMMEKFGFAPITEWSYFGSCRPILLRAVSARMATPDDFEKIKSYLASSSVFEKSAGYYFKSWRWYRLDAQSIKLFLDRDCIVVTGDPVNGIAIINKDGFWNRKDAFQIVYLDASGPDMINEILSLVTSLCEGSKTLQILCHESLTQNVSGSGILPERFLLYHKKLLPPR